MAPDSHQPTEYPSAKNSPGVPTDLTDRFGRLFDLIGDAVVEIELVEQEPVVRTVNPAFEDIFGYSREDVLGESLNEFILPEEGDSQAATFDQRTAAGKDNHAIVRRQTATGVREFLYRGVPYKRKDGRQFAFAIYSDITEQRTYERHIKVIHRILRHNLRNNLSVILTAATQTGEMTDDPEIEDLSAMVARHARSLETLGEETRTLEQILTGDQTSCPLDLTAICEDAVESITADHPDIPIRLNIPESTSITGIPKLQTAIYGLVENAVIHNTGEVNIELVGTQTDDHIVLEIRDNGPGIPEDELTPLLPETQITQLQHGSGLGLWLARCAIEASDGQLTYNREGGWTVLQLVFRPA